MEHNTSMQTDELRVEVEATLAEHRAWTFNRFKEQNGAHVIACRNTQPGAPSHVFPVRTVRNGVVSKAGLPLCGASIWVVDVTPVMAVWPSCPGCAAMIYSMVKTSLPEETSLESEVSGNPGQLVLPGAENW